MYTCPVCGYDSLRRPPINFTICPSCGTEFSYSDSGVTPGELQRRWLLSGARWHSNVTQPPPGWNAREQLLRLNKQITDTDNETFTIPSQVHIAGTVMPEEQASVLSATVEFFGSLYDLAFVRPVHL